MSLLPLFAWLFALNAMCLIPFTYGPLTFACLLVAVWLLWRTQRATEHPLQISVIPLRIIIGISALPVLISAVAGFILTPDPMIDIGINTVAAIQHFLQGHNPYTHTAQLWVSDFPADTPHMTMENGQMLLFGIPYYHGYPYFPMMMLSYLPASILFEEHTAIRITHILLILLNLLAFYLLASRFSTNRTQRQWIFLCASAAWIGIIRCIPEALLLGVTDMLISTWLLFCFVALSNKQFFIAGLLLGCAQACKLLPAPLAFISIAWFLYGQRGFWTWGCGFVLASILLILPFVAWNPDGFISATIFYYLSHHQGGDMTSLWFFLPEPLKPAFLLAGIVLALACIPLFNPNRKNLAGSMAGVFASYTLFMAFSKMTHLNYFWAVLPVGSIALALFIFREEELPAQL